MITRQNTKIGELHIKGFVFLFPLLFAFCGGPKKIKIDIEGKILKPEKLTEKDYEKLKPLISKSKVITVGKLVNEEGVAVWEEKVITSPKEEKIRVSFFIREGDTSSRFDAELSSNDVIVFSQKIGGRKIEEMKEGGMCVEGEGGDEQPDLICKISFNVKPDVSPALSSYIEIRDAVAGASEENFCQVWADASRKLTKLPSELREIAEADIKSFFDSFSSQIEKRVSQIEKEVSQMNCERKGELAKIKSYFCLDPKILAKVDTLLRDCDAYALYNEAVDFWRQENSHEALKKLKEAVRIKPNFAMAYELQGDIYFETKRFDDAREQYEKAIENDPDNPQYHIKLADLLVKMNKLEEAEREYRKATDLDPNLHEIHYKRAKVLFDLERFEEASEPAKRAVEIFEKKEEVKWDKKAQRRLAEYKTLLGEIYLNLGREEEAVSEFKGAIDVWDESDRAYLHLARIFKQRGELDRAKDYYEKLLKLDSPLAEDGKIWYEYALLLKELERYDEMEDALKKAIRFSPDLADAHFLLAKLYSEKPEYSAIAQKHFEEAIKLKESEEFRKAYIDFLVKQGKWTLAKKQVDEMLKKYPESEYAKRRANDITLMLYRLNPRMLRDILSAELKKMSPDEVGMTRGRFRRLVRRKRTLQNVVSKAVDSIYSAFSVFPEQLKSDIAQSLNVSPEIIDKLDPYKKFALTVAFMDKIYGASKERGIVLQKKEKYKEFFSQLDDEILYPRSNLTPLSIISRLTAEDLGLKLVE